MALKLAKELLDIEGLVKDNKEDKSKGMSGKSRWKNQYKKGINWKKRRVKNRGM